MLVLERAEGSGREHGATYATLQYSSTCPTLSLLSVICDGRAPSQKYANVILREAWTAGRTTSSIFIPSLLVVQALIRPYCAVQAVVLPVGDGRRR